MGAVRFIGDDQEYGRGSGVVVDRDGSWDDGVRHAELWVRYRGLSSFFIYLVSLLRNLYSTFITPWSDSSAAHTVEPDFSLPACYNVQPPQPGPAKVHNFSEETLFFMFYAHPRDTLQEVAAQELSVISGLSVLVSHAHDHADGIGIGDIAKNFGCG